MAEKDSNTASPFDFDEQIERIHNLRKESDKFNAESDKLRAEIYKLIAEGNKFTWDKVLSPLALVIAGAIGGLVQYWLHH